MLHRLAIRDFVIVDALEIEFASGLSVLSGETGAGKSILVDALQLALGSRGDAGVVREGAARAEISAEFDVAAGLAPWLAEAGFDADTGDAGRMLLRRTIDAQGKSRAWINGSGATTLMEMYIVLRGCKKYLDSKGISIAAVRCGEFLTVQEMAGFQMCAAKLDDEMLACWNAPCNTPALTVP